MEPFTTTNPTNYNDDTREALLNDRPNIIGSEFRVKVFETDNCSGNWTEIGVGNGELIIVVTTSTERQPVF